MPDKSPHRKKFLTFLGFGFFLVASLCPVFLFFALNSPGFYQDVVFPLAGRQLEQKFKESGGFKITGTSVGQVKYRLPFNFNFEDIKIKGGKGPEIYDLSIKKLDLIGKFEKSGLKNLNGAMEGADLDFSAGRLENLSGLVNIFLKNNGNIESLRAPLTVSSMTVGDYELSDISTIMLGNHQFFEFTDFRARAYNGDLNGKIVLDYQPNVFYSIFINFKEIHLDELRKANDSLFSQVGGIIQGNANIQGDLKKVLSIESNIDTVKGAEMKASLLKAILTYIPVQSKQRKDLEALIKIDSVLPLEKAALSIQSVSDEKVKSQVTLKSKKVNLDMNLAIDTNIEGGLNNLLKGF